AQRRAEVAGAHPELTSHVAGPAAGVAVDVLEDRRLDGRQGDDGLGGLIPGPDEAGRVHDRVGQVGQGGFVISGGSWGYGAAHDTDFTQRKLYMYSYRNIATLRM